MAEQSEVTAAWMSSISASQTALHSLVQAGFAEVRTALAGKADKADVDSLRIQLAKKADKTDLSDIAERIERHGAEIDRLRSRQSKEEATTDALAGRRTSSRAKLRWLAGTAVTLPLGVLAIIQIVQLVK